MDEEDFELPEPIEHKDGSQEWRQPDSYFPVEIPEQDIEPVEADDDYSPAEEESEEDD